MSLRVEYRENFDRASGRARQGAVEGLRKASEHVLAEARKQVPHETGTLERSGVASVDEVDLTAAVSFDGPYAARQHEELTWRHDNGRNAKYLERPMNTERNMVSSLIAANIRRVLGS